MRFHVESALKEYKDRFSKYYDELKWLYCELYENQQDMFESLCFYMYDSNFAHKF